MKSCTGIVVIMLLLAAACAAMPQRQSQLRSQRQRLGQVKSQRQVELSSTPYPAAGFRPKIPFELPGERQPPLEEPLATTVASTQSKIAVEEFGSTEEQSATTEQLEQEQLEQEQQTNARTPANTYGAPEQPGQSSADDAEDAIEVVAQEPARDFQPPVREAAEDFAVVALDGSIAGQQPVADLPAVDQAETTLASDQEELVPATEAAAVPVSTYGAPRTPANSYGAPELDQDQDNELETDESQVELVGEAEQSDQSDQSEQSELDAADALALTSGRLVLLPFNAAGARFGRLVLAVEQPKQRQRLRSQRLRRI